MLFAPYFIPKVVKVMQQDTPFAVVLDLVQNKTKCKRTTPGIPTWSPTVVLTGPEDA